MKTTAQWLSLWIALIFGVILLIAFVAFPGFFPPMSPNLSAQQVADFYDHHRDGVRFSMITFDLCGIMLVPFFMVIVYQMKRMSTPSQVFAYAFLSAAASASTLFALADLLWLVAAFRPERDPQLVQLMNDMAWIVFTVPVGMLVVQNLCLALAIYHDAHPDPIMPRWVGHLSVVTGLAMVPSAFAAAVHTGPLAWNGFLSFWLRIIAYGVFFVVMFFVLRRAILREQLEAAG